MKSKDLTLNCNEYRDLWSLDSAELFFALPYELHIRGNKDYYKKYLNLFKIENNELKMIRVPEIKYHFYPDWETYTKEKLDKIAFEQLYRDYFNYLGNNGVANPFYLYLDYHFFTDEEKEIGKLLKEIFRPKQSNWEENIYKKGTESITHLRKYEKVNFERITTRKEIDTRDFNYKGYEVEQSYKIIYKRPNLFALSSHRKTIKQEININLPKHIILKQLDKIITMAKIDDEILTDEDKMKLAYFDKTNPPKLSKTIIKEFNKNNPLGTINEFEKKNLIRDLFCYDYFMLRFDELQKEREEEKKALKKEIDIINNNLNYSAGDKKEQITARYEDYPNHRKKIETVIFEELAQIIEDIEKQITTRQIKDNINKIKSLMNDENYLESNHYMDFINGYKTNK